MLALACGSFATAARADGDPASDVLATQSLFLPQDAGIPLPQQSQLTGLLQASASSGYPIRVAIIATKADLGSVTELWRQPQTYARFLGQELSLVYRGPLLVVMPGGYGFYRLEPPLPAGPVPTRRTPAPRRRRRRSAPPLSPRSSDLPPPPAIPSPSRRQPQQHRPAAARTRSR